MFSPKKKAPYALSQWVSQWLGRFALIGTPIRTLGANHRQRIASHLLALNSRDRYLRFGYPAQDAQITRYVDGLNFERDEVLGIYDSRLELLAVAHLAYSPERRNHSSVEFGVSVSEQARGRGYGARLFARAAMRARNLGVQTMHIHALSENTAMLKIARAAGADVQRDGSESQAYLQLPEATLSSRLGERLQERIAKTDFRLKVRAHQVKALLGAPRQVL